VLIMRGQELSKADSLAYSRRFGRLKPHMIQRTRDPDNPEITLMGVTSMAKDGDGAKLILNRGEGWHTDSPWDTDICKGTQLYGIEIPSYGGDTLFASMHAAYDALPERLKHRIAPLKVAFRYGGRERKWFDLLEPADPARPPAVHDMMRAHGETGRKSLYVNPTHAVGIIGMTGTCCSPMPNTGTSGRRGHRPVGQPLHGAFGRRRLFRRRAAHPLAHHDHAVNGIESHSEIKGLSEIKAL
jgi:taurine dioxygenase